jgi:DNA polymerase
LPQLKALQDGKDLYKDFASRVFYVAYEDVTKDQRFIGKVSQLSLIYGVGSSKLQAAIKSGSGVDIGSKEAQRIVSLYRSEYKHVADFWDRCNDSIAGWVVSLGRRGLVKRTLVNSKGIDILKYSLPSGLYLQYAGVGRNDAYEWVYHVNKHNKVTQEKLYGGKIMNNIVQSLARCVMSEAMLKLEKFGYLPALCIHDAVYLVVDDNDVAIIAAKETLYECLTLPPSWLPEIKLDAEVKVGMNIC